MSPRPRSSSVLLSWIALAPLSAPAAGQDPTAAELWRSGRRLEAVEHAARDLEAAPDDGALRARLVAWEMQVHRYEAALEHMPAGDPRRGLALYALARYQEALRHLDPADAAHCVARVESFESLGRFEEADAAVERAAELLGADDPRVLAWRGRAAARRGEHGTAATLFERCLERDPMHLEALFGLGQALVRTDRREEAAEVLARHRELVPLVDRYDFARQSLDLDPHHGPNLAQLALIEARLGRLDAAEASFAAAVRWGEGDERLPIVLRFARFLEEVRGDRTRAVAALEAELARATSEADRARLLVRAADVLERDGRLDEALARLEEARALRPDDDAIGERIGRVRGALGGRGAGVTRGARSLLAVAYLAGCGTEATSSPPDPAPRAAGDEARSSELGAEGDTPARGWFREVGPRWGIDFVHDAGFSAEKHLPETMGAGAALFDADGDGDLDVYFVQSGPMPVGAARTRAADLPPNRLYRNVGSGKPAGGRFEDATAQAGAAAHRGYGMGVAVGDTDGDGDEDLFVTNFGPDALFANDGSGRFADASDAAGVGDGRWTAGAVFFDADLDGDLDLYVTAYVQIDVEHPAWCGKREPGWRSYCHPDHYEGLPDRFWQNRGDGTFADATRAAGLSDNAGKGLGAIAGDWDADGDPDLYVANDSVENRFWRNRGDGTFEDDTLLTGTGVNGRGATEAGMGLAAGDVDGDGDFDLFVTNFDEESNTLYRNEGGGLFRDATAAAGLDAPSRLPVGFGTVLEDFDGDGALDLAVANGHIIDNIHLYHDGKSWAQRAQLYAGDGAGRFRLASEEAGDLAREPLVGRGLYSGDLDGDGDPDLLLTQCGARALVLENRAPGARFLHVVGPARGSVLRATLSSGRRLVRDAGGGPSYFGHSALGTFLGLGGTERVNELEIVQPAGVRRLGKNELPGGGQLRLTYDGEPRPPGERGP